MLWYDMGSQAIAYGFFSHQDQISQWELWHLHHDDTTARPEVTRYFIHGLSGHDNVINV